MSATADRSAISRHATRITNTFMTSLNNDLAANRYGEEESAILRQSRSSINEVLNHTVSVALKYDMDFKERKGETAGSMDNVEFTSTVITPAAGVGVMMSGYLSGDGWSGSTSTIRVPLARLP
ncbi:hypothetical protein B9479_004188 [Cryptococcus floricola]|uniref:Uncharacterized protein n=1 Tax=Cryptococcus floricola TaxID=2591691 RepID=A0A5D3AYH3_9TREE|nr:hypothetical protein B9479_004188 [Cryptococcus floricola]